MSGPQDIQNGMKMLGMGGGPAGPRPTMPIGQTKKPMGDSRVPISNERPRVNPGQMQDRAARQLGVPNYRVQPQDPSTRPPPAPQGIPMPRPDPRGREPEPNPSAMPSGIPMPRSRPPGAPLPPEVNPNPMADGMAMPRSRPPEAGPRQAQTGDPGQLNRMVSSVLERIMQGAKSDKPINTFPYFDVPAALGMTKPAGNNATATAKTTDQLPQGTDPFKSGAAPVQGGMEQLMPVIAAAAKAKAEQSRPPVTQSAPTPASPSVTPPVPPGQPLPPPPSMQPPMGAEGNPDNFQPSTPTFRGYQVVPPKAEKGAEKHSNRADKKGNSPYYYTRVGAQIGDNTAVAQRIKEIREKAANPRTAKNMTVEEDRILSQYADGSAKNADTSLLASMEPAAVAERMRMYKSGNLTSQIPDRYDARPPGVSEGDGTRTPLKLPPKSQDKKLDAAERKAQDAIQNPPNKNDVDTDVDVKDE